MQMTNPQARPLRKSSASPPKRQLAAGGALQRLLPTPVPTDPLIYRWYEIVNVYGTTIKELIHEEFGDGISERDRLLHGHHARAGPEGATASRGSVRQVPPQDLLNCPPPGSRPETVMSCPRRNSFPAPRPAPAPRWPFPPSPNRCRRSSGASPPRIPKSLDTVFGGADLLTKRVAALTGGRFQIQVFAAGEIVLACRWPTRCRTAPSSAATPTATTTSARTRPSPSRPPCPSASTQRQQNALDGYGGRRELVSEFEGVQHRSFPGGNTGTQMGGWFRKEMKTVADIKGLKIRIAGLAARVAKTRRGAAADRRRRHLPGARERHHRRGRMVGPYDDEKLGFTRWPKPLRAGWWEPNSAYSFYVSVKEWGQAAPRYQAAFESAAYAVNADMMAEYDAEPAGPEAADRQWRGCTCSPTTSSGPQNAAHAAVRRRGGEESGLQEDLTCPG